MKMYCLRYYHWLFSKIMRSSYCQPSYRRPLLSPWSINPFCPIHISTPALTTPLFSHWPIRMGHFWRLNTPWPMRGQDLPHLYILLCKSAPHCYTQIAPKGYLYTTYMKRNFLWLICGVQILRDEKWGLIVFLTPFRPYGRQSPPKGCQMLKKVSNVEWNGS